MIHRLSLVVLSSLVVAASPKTHPAPTRTAKPTVPTGTWRFLQGINDDLTYSELEDSRVHIEDAGQFRISFYLTKGGKQKSGRHNVEIDPIRFTMDHACYKMIYRFNGETLTICFGEHMGERPTEFTAPKGSGRQLWLLRREKR